MSIKHPTKTHQREALATRGPPTYELGRYLFQHLCLQDLPLRVTIGRPVLLDPRDIQPTGQAIKDTQIKDLLDR